MLKEGRDYTKFDKTVHLNKDVVVSDPCYELGIWCQAVLNNVNLVNMLLSITKQKTVGLVMHSV